MECMCCLCGRTVIDMQNIALLPRTGAICIFCKRDISTFRYAIARGNGVLQLICFKCKQPLPYRQMEHSTSLCFKCSTLNIKDKLLELKAKQGVMQ